MSISSWRIRIGRIPEALWVALALGATLTVLSVCATAGLSAPALASMRQHLGAENYNIARALVDGRGFSDPFAERTGPTAWMPPVMPAILALGLWATGSRAATAEVVVVLTTLVWIVGGMVIHDIARRRATCLPPLCAVAYYVTWIWVFRLWTLVGTHDVWLIALVALGLVWELERFSSTGTCRPWVWGFSGGLVVLAAPGFSLAWGALVLVLLFRSWSQRRRWLLAATVAACVAAPWAIRNAIVFHQLVPTKSNLFYDAYLANCVDADGVVDAQSTAVHPFVSQAARFEYSSRGESGYIQHARALVTNCVARDPKAALGRVRNRAIAALLRYVPFAEDEALSPLWLPRFVYALPLCAFLLAVGWPGPNRRLLRDLGLLIGCALLPYILVSFYARYAMPLTVVCPLVVFFGFDRMAFWSFRRSWTLRLREV